MKLILSSDAEQIIQDQLRNNKFASAEAVVLAGLKSLSTAAPNEFNAGEIEALLNEGEESIKREGTLDADESLAVRRANRQHPQSGGGMKLRVSRRADRDIENIWQFIARDSPTAATKVEDDIHAAMNCSPPHPTWVINGQMWPTIAIDSGRSIRTSLPIGSKTKH